MKRPAGKASAAELEVTLCDHFCPRCFVRDPIACIFRAKIETRPSQVKRTPTQHTTQTNMAEYVNILPADENTKGNVWCAACEQSIRAANEERHLISAKHTENAAQSKAAAEAKKAPKAKKETEKPAKKAEEKPAKAPKATKAPKVARSAESSEAPEENSSLPDAANAEAYELLPLDPRPAPGKEGNRYCGICEQSLGPAKVKSHLGSKKHQANADKVLVNAMQKVGV